MKIDFKYIAGILGTIIIGLSTWTLVSIVDLKESNSYIKVNYSVSIKILDEFIIILIGQNELYI